MRVQSAPAAPSVRPVYRAHLSGTQAADADASEGRLRVAVNAPLSSLSATTQGPLSGVPLAGPPIQPVRSAGARSPDGQIATYIFVSAG